jgi:hypothetical protein
MSAQMLFGILKQQGRVIRQEIEAWKLDHDEAMKVRDLQDLIQACLLERDKDNSFIRLILDKSHMLSPEGLDKINDLIQECCDDALATLDKLSEAVQLAEAKGLPVEHATSIAKAAEDYRRWKEDTPELLLLNHGPVGDQIRERIRAAVNSPALQSDWRELFPEDAQ